MRLTECDIKGAFLVELSPRRDARGFMARAFCAQEFGEVGLETAFVHVPPLCAHAVQALTDNVELLNQASAFYAPEYEKGLRFDDPAIAIDWPLPMTELSRKDASWAPYRPSVLSTAP